MYRNFAKLIPLSHLEAECSRNKTSFYISWILKRILKFWLHSECVPHIWAHSCGRPERFEVHSTWRNVERHSKCILTALLLHLNILTGRYGIPTAFEIFWSPSRENRNGKPPQNPARITRMRLEWAGMHLDCISIAAGIYCDIKIIQLECNSNAVGIFRLPLECGSNAVGTSRLALEWSNRISRNIFKEFLFQNHSASSVTRVWNSLPNVARILNIFIPAGSTRFLLFPNKCDGGISKFAPHHMSICQNAEIRRLLHGYPSRLRGISPIFEVGWPVLSPLPELFQS